MYRLRLGGVHLSFRSRSSGRVSYDCRSSLRRSASPFKYSLSSSLPTRWLISRSTTLAQSPLTVSKLRTATTARPMTGTVTGNGRGPEKPLLCIHITYIVGIHAEQRGNINNVENVFTSSKAKTAPQYLATNAGLNSRGRKNLKSFFASFRNFCWYTCLYREPAATRPRFECSVWRLYICCPQISGIVFFFCWASIVLWFAPTFSLFGCLFFTFQYDQQPSLCFLKRTRRTLPVCAVSPEILFYS